MLGRVRPVRSLLVGLLATAAALGLPGLAQAQQLQNTVVSDNPANFTPNLLKDATVAAPAVYALAQGGASMYAGGQFHAVENAARTTQYVRSNIFAFDAASGAVSTSFVPVPNGLVWALLPSGSALFVGGQFSTVNGITRHGLAKLDPATGAVDPAFVPALAYGYVKEIRLVGGHLIVSGSFPQKLVSLNPSTGADDHYISLAGGITGTVAANAGPTHVYKFAVNPAGTRLVGLGNFTTVGGQPRQRAFMLDLGTTVTVDPWYYQPLTKLCASRGATGYLRDVDFSPDGSYFVFVSTGFVSLSGDLGLTLCDAAARFETDIAAPARPTWINYTGGDTLHSVAITGAAVYVNGHNRWLDNPQGRDSCGTGCVSRPGIGAIDPVTGKALPWNPGKTRGVGGKDLLVTPTGLWVASDGDKFNGEYRYGIAFLPL